jgi:hypothetical protein
MGRKREGESAWEQWLAAREASWLVAPGDGGLDLGRRHPLTVQVKGWVHPEFPHELILIECPFCDCFHTHGLLGGGGNRSEHCWLRYDNIPVSGYDIVLSKDVYPLRSWERDRLDERISRKFYRLERRRSRSRVKAGVYALP